MFCPSTCCAHTPVLVHHEVPGLRKLRQVGQQGCHIIELCMLVVTFCTEYVHQLRQTNLLLKNLEKTKIRQCVKIAAPKCVEEMPLPLVSMCAIGTLKTVLQVSSLRLRLEMMEQI